MQNMTERLSLESYCNLILAIKNTKRSFASFSSASPTGVLLRLDVDYDMEWAARTAEINAQLDVRACYFIQVGSGLYNTADTRGLQAISTIVESGQDVGLHFHNRGSVLDVKRLLLEHNLLKLLIPNISRAVAWHNPEGDLAALNSAATDLGLASAYGAPFFVPEHYVSDSNLRNNPQEIATFVQSSDAPLVQVLLHPLNWVIGGKKMSDILLRSFKEKVEQLITEFNTNSVWREEKVGKEVVRTIRTLRVNE